MHESMQHADGALSGHNSGGESLEAGIASIFAAIQAEDGMDDGDESLGDQNLGDIEVADALLNELNRLWTQPDA